MRAIWKNVTLAGTDQTIVVEGNYYFSPESIDRKYFKESDTKTTCFWKGRASYYHLTVCGQQHEDAAWYYPQPKQAAAKIKDHIAFWKGVEIVL